MPKSKKNRSTQKPSKHARIKKPTAMSSDSPSTSSATEFEPGVASDTIDSTSAADPMNPEATGDAPPTDHDDSERVPLNQAMGTAKRLKRRSKTDKAAGSRKPQADKPQRLSGLDAAAAVLAKATEPMNAKAIVEAMAEQKLWSSPGGKTPAATIYSAMLREIATKGKQSRFRKSTRGLFTAGLADV